MAGMPINPQDTEFYPEIDTPYSLPYQSRETDKTCRVDVDFQIQCTAFLNKWKETPENKHYKDAFMTVVLYLFNGGFKGTQLIEDATNISKVIAAYKLLDSMCIKELGQSEVCTLNFVLANVHRRFRLDRSALERALLEF